MWLGTFSQFSTACPSCFSASVVTPDFALPPPSILNLVVLMILLAWLPGTQIFSRPVGVTNLYSAQKDYSTATTTRT